MQVLCATDLTERSLLAMRRAFALARNACGSLTLLHVLPNRATNRTRLAPRYGELMSLVESEFGSWAAGIDIHIRRGSLFEVIASTAAARSADLIVIAAPKARRLESIVGTTAERLVRTAGRPVLVVRADAGVGGERVYGRVVVAADLTAASGPMLRGAVRLAGLEQSFSTVVHAAHAPYDGMMRAAGLEETTIEDYHQGFEARARDELRRLAADAGLPFEHCRVVVRREPAAQVIREVLEQEQPDLLALGASRWFLIKRLLMGSVADQALRTARCDVLVIPHRRAADAAISHREGSQPPALRRRGSPQPARSSR